MNNFRFIRTLPLIAAITLLLSFSGDVSVQRVSPSKASVEFFMREYKKDFHPDLDFSKLIFVSLNYQKLYLLENEKMVKSYNISSSKFGIGNKANSQKTPVGLHRIRHKIGAGAPLNGIIKAGVYTGKKATIIKEPKVGTQDLVTTRVMWLQGQEEGVNKGSGIDSYARNIYIHGTPEEGLIGTPASHGCIRMLNTDVIDLFNKAPKMTYVLILEI